MTIDYQSDFRKATATQKQAKAVVSSIVKASKAIDKKKKSYKSKIPLNVFGGNKKMIKMVYVRNVLVTSGATANTFSGQQSFRLNNVNLPFVGQSGTAPDNTLPQGYTQAAQAFRYFKVYGAKVKVEWFNATANCQVGLLATSSGDVQTLQSVISKTADMKRGCDVKSLTQDAGDKVTMTKYYKIGAFDGLKKAQFENDISSYNLLFNSDATTAGTDELGTTGDLMRKKILRLHTAIAPLTAAAVSVDCRWTITYYTLVWGKETLPESTSTAS